MCGNDDKEGIKMRGTNKEKREKEKRKWEYINDEENIMERTKKKKGEY